MRSVFFCRYLSFSLLGVLALSWAVEAAPNKKKPHLETYAATEDRFTPGTMEPTPVEITHSVQIHTRLQAPSVRKAEPTPVILSREPKARVSRVRQAAGVAASAENSSATYDPVPLSQANGIAKRLKVVEQLIRKYGRAYDYRTHTLKELEGICARLEASAADAARETLPEAAPADDLSSLPTPIELDSSHVDDEL